MSSFLILKKNTDCLAAFANNLMKRAAGERGAEEGGKWGGGAIGRMDAGLCPRLWC